MGQKQRLFIYDRKEMGVLLLLGVMVAVFAFTLGVHLGKRVGPKGMVASPKDATPVTTVADAVPERHEITEQGKNVLQTVDETLNQAVHDEVARSGIRMETPRAIELPTSVRPKRVGSAQVEYTLQVGSYAVLEEAKARTERLTAEGLKQVLLQEVDLKEKGKRYRVYVGVFGSAEEAKQAGAQYQAKNLIQSFVVSNKAH